MDNSDNWHEPDPGDLQNIRYRRESPTTGNRDAFIELKEKLCDEIASNLDPSIDVTDTSQLRPYVHERLDQLLIDLKLALNRTEKRQLLEAIVVELSGFQK